MSSSASAFARRSRRGTPAQPQGQFDVASGGQPGHERRLLEHHGRPVGGRLDAPGGRLVEPRDEVQQGRLAASGRAEQAHELAGGDVEVDAVEHERAVAESLADLLDAHGGLDGRRGRRAPA